MVSSPRRPAAALRAPAKPWLARRIALGAGVLGALWLGALLVIGHVVGRGEPARIATRLGESMQGSASVGDVDLGLVRGELAIDRLAVHRDDAVGTLSLDVPEVHCELAPLGGALFDRSCGTLDVRGARLEISSFALFHVPHRKHPPLRVGGVAISDASFAFLPSALAPGVGRVAVRIDRAAAGPTVLRTPFSWIFALETLDATVELPAGLAVHVTYRDGQLAASGALFGEAPVAIPVELPQPGEDGRAETRALVAFGEDIAERLVAKRAVDWLGGGR